MVSNSAPPLRVVLYEGDGSKPLTSTARAATTAALLDRGYSLTVISRAPDFSRNHLQDTSSAFGFLVLGDFNGQPPEVEKIETPVGTQPARVVDIGGKSAEQVLSLVESSRATQPMNQPGGWKPWFPVIDYDRCTNCMQCLSFCLFDVYGVSTEGKIQVQNNDNCKTNCPACSRVCPEVAIMFPKYQSGPINGERVNTDDVRREKMKIDITSLLGGDIYARLKDRSAVAKSRFSKERSPDKALDERKKCLTKLAADGFIPAEVLADLPSPEEIARKAALAAERAKAALALQS